MTVSVIIAGPLPILYSQGAGADVSLILIPVVYSLWYGKTLADSDQGRKTAI